MCKNNAKRTCVRLVVTFPGAEGGAVDEKMRDKKLERQRQECFLRLCAVSCAVLQQQRQQAMNNCPKTAQKNINRAGFSPRSPKMRRNSSLALPEG